MTRRAPSLLIGKLTLLTAVLLGGTAAGADDSAHFNDLIAPLLQQHCVKCHGGGDRLEAGLDLQAIESAEHLTSDLDRLESLIEALDFEAMPPDDQPPLAAEKRGLVVARLQHMLRTAVSAQGAFPPTPIRRMNRFQYSNAVEDLFQLNVEVFALPERMLREYGYFQPEKGSLPDQLRAGSRPLGKSQLIGRRLAGVAPFPQDLRAEHGFDNRADHLSLSPLLLESFFKLSRSIVESPDFNRKTCGIWHSFFEPPQNEENFEQVIRQRVEEFLTRAFRRPVEAEVLDRYVLHATGQIEQGVSFTESMKQIASAALASPRFLYLYDQASAGEPTPTEDAYDLATRLSFFLWGSLPDEELLELAADGRLSDPEVLAGQVDRMLADRRLKRFCDSFPAQWLQLERIVSSVPDPDRFPQFYFTKYRASMHMMLEPLLLFEAILVENRSILQLIDSDFSYRSDLLVSWYERGKRGGRTPPTAIPFRRVKLTDRRQGGVITTAAIMTMTSGTTRTKPITRGAWMASVVFNNPPEPPPADVPPLEQGESEETKNLTLRERLVAHRERAACAGCHAQIDPLGFALENYGPTGRWRETYDNGRQIDTSGKLFKKHEFENIVEFKQAILQEKDRFTRAFAGHLLSFALARELSAADSSALDTIVKQTKTDGYRMKTLVKAVVLSEPFLQGARGQVSQP